MRKINSINCYTINDANLITPELAACLLQNNACIKKVNTEELKKIKKDLIAGNFKFNGATISLNEKGQLIDGQLRLLACAETGISFKSLIVYGLSSQEQYVKDTGKSRNIIQLMTKKGYKNSKALYYCTLILYKILKSNNETIDESYEFDVTNTEVFHIIELFPKLIDSVNLIMKNKNKYLTTEIYQLIILDYLCRIVDNTPMIADKFLKILSNEEPTESTNPVFILRNILMNSIISKKNLSKRKQLGLLIQSYNLFKQNKNCLRLKWNKSNKMPLIYMRGYDENNK